MTSVKNLPESINEIIFYKNINELADKIKYYSKNEKVRIKIASSNRKAIRYSRMNFVTENQLASKQRGNNIAVRITKKREIPSTPKEILTFANGNHNTSTQCWNFAVD